MASILLVDDDKTFLNGLKMFFDMENIQVSTTTTVSTAKVLLDTEDISLVCTDWELPDGTGLDVLAYARKNDIPVVFLTGHDEDSYQEQAITQGAMCYYIKGELSYSDLIDNVVSLARR